MPALVLLALAIASLVLALATQAAAHRVLSHRRPPARRLPPISILKPLKGVDDELFDNLSSFARLDYPSYEILLGIAEKNDPALEVARRVQRAFPWVDIRVLVCDRPFGRNPKVTILAALEAAAKNDLILISDSNVRARPDYLRAMAAELDDERVGLVSNVLAGVGEESMGSLLENLQLGSFVAASVCAGDLVGHACVVGKSMLMRRTDLNALGGLRAVRHVLAEDYILGQRFQRAGFRVALSNHVVETVNARWSTRRFLERHLRWAQMRRRLHLFVYVGEPLLNPTPFLLALIVCAGADVEVLGLAPWTVASLALAGIGLKLASDVRLLARLRGRALPLLDLPLVLVKDALLMGVWAVGAFRRTVRWRGNVLRLTSGSRLLAVRAQRAAEAETALAREAA